MIPSTHLESACFHFLVFQRESRLPLIVASHDSRIPFSFIERLGLGPYYYQGSQ